MIAYTKSILVVTEMQEDMVSGALADPKASEVATNIAEFMKSQKFKGVIFTLKNIGSAVEYPKTQEAKWVPEPHCIVGTKGHNICDKLSNAVKVCSGMYGSEFNYETVNRYGSYEDVALSMADILEEWLDSDRSEIPIRQKIQAVRFYIAGTRTDGAVLNTALAIRNVPEFNKFNEITVLSDLCSADNTELHEAALTVLKNNAINIKTVAEALKRER